MLGPPLLIGEKVLYSTKHGFVGNCRRSGNPSFDNDGVEVILMFCRNKHTAIN